MLKINLSLVCAIDVVSFFGVGFSFRVGAQAAQPTDPTTGTLTYTLPGDQVFPEGIAYDAVANAFYVGSTDDGTIFRGDLETGEVTVFAEGGIDGRTAITGVRVDREGRLYAAGRRTGQVFVYDTLGGGLLGRFDNGLDNDETLVNDIAVTPDGAAYVTDSFSPFLYRIAPEALSATSRAGAEVATDQLDVFVDFTGTVFEYETGFNANGIVSTPDGTYLLIVSFNSGRLYRVEVNTKSVTEIELGGAVLTGGDGMALDGQELYVVRDDQATIAHVTLADDFASGSIGEEFTDQTFDYPTTMALLGDGTALVVNSQLDMQSGSQPNLPFTVSRITLPTEENVGATPLA